MFSRAPFFQRQKREHMKALGKAIDELVDRLGIGRKVREYEAVLQWGLIVGEKVAGISAATGIQKGVLIVRVRTAPWRNELNLLKPEIIRKMNEALGEEIVKDIRFL